jgi:hypothetical protein
VAPGDDGRVPAAGLTAVPLQNRVDPYGRLHAVAERGTLMGNRGILHDESRRLVAAWRLRRWITCTLTFKGRRRQVFAPRRYSELFFLDEATALSAGHRPCAECRRKRYEEFREAWTAGRGVQSGRSRADDIDRVLHSERVEARSEKKTYDAALASLPHGTVVEWHSRPHLLLRGRLLPWSFAGYGPGSPAPASARVRVLTPESIVAAIRSGFVPGVHPSAVEPEGPRR